jgi:hypothetical protein
VTQCVREAEERGRNSITTDTLSAFDFEKRSEEVRESFVPGLKLFVQCPAFAYELFCALENSREGIRMNDGVELLVEFWNLK